MTSGVLVGVSPPVYGVAGRTAGRPWDVLVRLWRFKRHLSGQRSSAAGGRAGAAATAGGRELSSAGAGAGAVAGPGAVAGVVTGTGAARECQTDASWVLLGVSSRPVGWLHSWRHAGAVGRIRSAVHSCGG